MKKAKKRKIKFRFPTYLVYLFLLGLGAFLFGVFMNDEGSHSGKFLHYAGPVMPMTSLNGAEGVDAARHVDFDFSAYENGDSYHFVGKGAAGITDIYSLTNTGDETRTLELVYAFQGSFTDSAAEFPAIKVDGQEVQPELFPSIDPEQLLYYAGSFEKYSSILAENDFLGIAAEHREQLNIPVTAYHFTELSYDGTDPGLNPMLTIRCRADENTSVWTSGVSKINTEKDGSRLLFISVRQDEAWIFTAGGTLIDPEFGGNKDWNIEKNSAIDGVNFHLETSEITLMDAVRLCAEQYPEVSQSNVSPEQLAEYTVRRIQTLGILETLRWTSFDHLFYEELNEIRMMYLIFPVALEPGQSVTVEASYIQEPSWDGSGPKPFREGYDLATKLGSSLNFTDLTSSLSNTGAIVLGEQNFGFDLLSGITEVSLSLDVERYYLEVLLKE